ncbi:MAG TPA: hypothetical protein QF753_17320 [Victivallales bacterium]|nr:hypothetical protein [Victivallales bacterium]
MKNILYSLVILLLSLLYAVPGIEAAQEYTGTVTPTVTSSCAFVIYTDIIGNYAYIARPGEIITPQISNSKGEIIKHSNVLLQMNMDYWEAVLTKNKSIYQASVQDVKLADIQRLRYRKLYKDGKATSLEKYQQAETAYWNAIINWANARANYIRYIVQTKKYTDIAPFEGLVTEDLTTVGQSTSGSPAVKLVQLNPIGVKIKMDRNTAKTIGNNTPVKIFPVNSNTPQGIIYGISVLTDDGIEFVTENYPVIEGTKVIQNNNNPIIRNWFPVVKFYVHSNPEVLAVAANSLVKDGNRHFVWKAKGQKTMQIDKTIDHSFQIEKVYVKPADLLRIISSFDKKIALKDCGNLELYDLVMVNPPVGLTDGQTVLFPEGNYLLMPGDNVKVVVGGK